MASLKIDNFLKPFRGKGDDFDTFWKKFQVVCSLQKIATPKGRMEIFPLFLEGDAFHLFSQLSGADQEDESKVKGTFETAYVVTPSEAYRKFKHRQLRLDEPVDTYVSDLKRLLALSGHVLTGDKDPVLLEQLVCGLPAEYARQVRLAYADAEMTVSGCLGKVRALRSTESSSKQPNDAVGAASQRDTPRSVLCYNCNEVGHVKRHCPRSKPHSSQHSGSGGGQRHNNSSSSNSSARRSSVICFFCDQSGHVKKDCPARKQWLESTRASSAAASDAATTNITSDKCLCVANLQRPGLPKVFVFVSEPGGLECRVRSVIDTGSTRTLVTSSVAEQLHLPVAPHVGQPIVALDGVPLQVLGVATAQFQRHDSTVVIPSVSIDVLVVPELSVVATGVLIGSDMIGKCGGLQLRYDNDKSLCGVVLGPNHDTCAAASDALPLRHVTVTTDGDDVFLKSDDGMVHWDASQGCWVLHWTWKDGQPPTHPVGPGIGEYSRAHLSPTEEAQFSDEIQRWINDGWLVPHDESVHGAPACVLPWLAVSQPHKSSTPVRPCLDYRRLNDAIVSSPGLDAPACAETLRAWRAESPDDHVLLDLRKAYLQVRVHPDLLRYQVVLWQGKSYVMTRMGFGLNVAPKFMDMIVRWTTHPFRGVDNYIDDLRVPAALSERVAARLAQYGLISKPEEAMSTSRVLGLQLSIPLDDGQVMWRRRDGVQTTFDEPLTKRRIFQWCGRLTSHYPVAGWLRPACSMVKRLAGLEKVAWDEAVSDDLLQICRDLQSQFDHGDPVRGVWRADVTAPVVVWCDASDLALAAAVEIDGAIVEDGTWMRAVGESRHINIAELDAALKGLKLAVAWKATDVVLKTDSKTVAAWLDQVFQNVQRIKTKGLNDVLIQRRLQVVADLIDSANLHARVEWVPSAENRADALTRVPGTWTAYAKTLIDRAATSNGSSDKRRNECVAAMSSITLPPVVPLAEIATAQAEDSTVRAVITSLQNDSQLPSEFKAVRSQLVVCDGVLFRSVKLPIDGVVTVPVVPSALVSRVVSSAHDMSGHASWEKMYHMLRACCFFPNLAAACQSFVSQCATCCAANPRRGPTAAASRPSISGRPWGEVVLDVLELGPDHGSEYHCVLVCIDTFTKWVEVTPLRHHDAQSVASAFVHMCLLWGTPDCVRTDNGTEFCNAIVSSVFQVMGVTVLTGAVRHPQSQGSAERMNQTLLQLIRKLLNSSGSSWLADLDMLLHHYRYRPHSALGISPFQAMVGWQPTQLLVASDPPIFTASQWADQLAVRSARTRDFLEEALSRADFVEDPQLCPYAAGDQVMLLRPERHQKRQSAFEDGWTVKSVISHSTVIISMPQRRDKTVNIDLLKLSPAGPVVDLPVPDVPPAFPEDSVDPDDSYVSVEWLAPSPVSPYGLRNRAALRAPDRF